MYSMYSSLQVGLEIIAHAGLKEGGAARRGLPDAKVFASGPVHVCERAQSLEVGIRGERLRTYRRAERQADIARRVRATRIGCRGRGEEAFVRREDVVLMAYPCPVGRGQPERRQSHLRVALGCGASTGRLKTDSLSKAPRAHTPGVHRPRIPDQERARRDAKSAMVFLP
jgi:hypothetical protein